jgi:hypothetical protein
MECLDKILKLTEAQKSIPYTLIIEFRDYIMHIDTGERLVVNSIEGFIQRELNNAIEYFSLQRGYGFEKDVFTMEMLLKNLLVAYYKKSKDKRIEAKKVLRFFMNGIVMERKKLKLKNQKNLSFYKGCVICGYLTLLVGYPISKNLKPQLVFESDKQFVPKDIRDAVKDALENSKQNF